MSNEAVPQDSGHLSYRPRSNIFNAETLHQYDSNQNASRRPSDVISPITYRYCTPSQWRKQRQGIDPDTPLAPGTFPFLSLPAELRNAIYRELLLTTIPLQLVLNRPSWPDIATPGKKIHPTLLQVSRAVCHEGLAILYGENTWYLQIDTTPARYRADMLRLNPTFRLPPPLTTSMSHIRRVVMHFGSIDRTRSKQELYLQFLNVGMRLDDLQLLAIQFSDEYVLRKNKRANVGWLEEKDGRELNDSYVWFPEGTMADEGWLVMKEEKQVDVGVGKIPGLGVC